MDVDASSRLLGLGRVGSKVPGVVAAQVGTGVAPSTAFGVRAADRRRDAGLTRTRKAAAAPVTVVVDRFESEWYPLPLPCLAADAVVAAAGTRFAGR